MSAIGDSCDFDTGEWVSVDYKNESIAEIGGLKRHIVAKYVNDTVSSIKAFTTTSSPFMQLMLSKGDQEYKMPKIELFDRRTSAPNQKGQPRQNPGWFSYLAGTIITGIGIVLVETPVGPFLIGIGSGLLGTGISIAGEAAAARRTDGE